MSEQAAFSVGTRVRVVPGSTISSRIAAGKTGTVVEYEEQHIPMLEAFPISVILDGRSFPQVWNADELEATA